MLRVKPQYERVPATFSLISQGNWRFYSLTLSAKLLAQTCFVTDRFEDPLEGFQRMLDERRARSIAQYIDSGQTIPVAIILSAQSEADLQVRPGGRALTFVPHPKAFLILDGQHRVFGFKLAKTNLRVPVIIYRDLTRQQETRLFIDINTKQKPVPNELLLDIKRLADIESDEESYLRELFDLFNTQNDSIFLGKMSPTKQTTEKISRVSFNASCKPILQYLRGRSVHEVYEVINAYLTAFAEGLDKIDYRELMQTRSGFRAIMAFFPNVASRVKGQYNGDYSTENFSDLLSDLFDNISKSSLSKVRNSAKDMQELFEWALTKAFQL